MERMRRIRAWLWWPGAAMAVRLHARSLWLALRSWPGGASALGPSFEQPLDPAGRSWPGGGLACLVAVALAAGCAPAAAPDAGGGRAAGEPAPRKEIIQPEGVALPRVAAGAPIF